MNSAQAAWQAIRTDAGADAGGVQIGAANADWNQRSTTRGKDIPFGAKAVLISVIGNHASDPADGTATIKLWAYRLNGPAQLIGTYDIIIGAQQVIWHPTERAATATKKWASNIAENAAGSWWISTPEIVGNVANNVACLAIKTYGAAYITAEVTAVGAGITVDVLMATINDLP